MRNREVVYVSTPEERQVFVQWRDQQLSRAMDYWRADYAEMEKSAGLINKGYAERLEKRGDCAEVYGRPDEAIFWYEKAIDIFTQLNESHGISLTLVKLASVHISKGDLAVGVDIVGKALPYYEADAIREKNSAWVSICADRLVETAKICQLLHRFEQAASLFDRAFEVRTMNTSADNKYTDDVIKIMELQADNLRDAGKFEEAHAQYSVLLEVAKSDTWSYGHQVTVCAARLAHICLLQGKRNHARLLVLQVKHVFEQLKKRYGRNYLAEFSAELDGLSQLAFDDHPSEEALSLLALPYKYGKLTELMTNREKQKSMPVMTIEDIAADWRAQDKMWQCIDSPEMAVEGLLTYGSRGNYAQAEKFIRSTLERNDFMVGRRYKWLEQLCAILSWYDRVVELREVSLEALQLYRNHSKDELQTIEVNSTTCVYESTLARHLEKSGCLVEALEMYRVDYQENLRYHKPDEQTMVWRSKHIEDVEMRIANSSS